MITIDLLHTILDHYKLPWGGIHGLPHWARVLENGRRLTKFTGARLAVVELFAVLHDAQRINEGADYNHGLRAADFAATLQGTLLNLNNQDFDLLHTACAYHTDGRIDGDITVQTCWDSDRLDLGRVGIIPQPWNLCTSAAKDPENIDWAIRRSQERHVPALILNQWGINIDHY